MNTRLEQFLSAENLSQSQFADSIKVARASVSHILAGRNKPGWDFLTSMMKHYPNLNLEWLMTGNGKMYKSAEAERNDFSPDLFSSVPQSDPRSQGNEDKVNQELSYPSVAAADPDTPRQVGGFSKERRQDLPQSPIQVIDNQRKIAKIMVFYDDNTFIEIK